MQWATAIQPKKEERILALDITAQTKMIKQNQATGHAEQQSFLVEIYRAGGRMNDLPFHQIQRGKYLIREFDANVDESKLVWHRDKHDRKILIKSGKGWKLQMENKLPVLLHPGKSYTIPRNIYHRILKGKENLVVEIYENKILAEFVTEVLNQESQILIPFPPEVEHRLKELPKIQSQYYSRHNPEIIQPVLDDITKSFDLVLTLSGIRSQKNLINQLKLETIPIIHLHKNYFNALRPNEFAEKHGVDFKSDYLESAQTPSYPSGHTTQAYYVAMKLSALYPNLKKYFFKMADMIAQARIDRGVHFPSDNEAGKLLAIRIFEKNQKSGEKP